MHLELERPVRPTRGLFHVTGEWSTFYTDARVGVSVISSLGQCGNVLVQVPEKHPLQDYITHLHAILVKQSGQALVELLRLAVRRSRLVGGTTADKYLADDRCRNGHDFALARTIATGAVYALTRWRRPYCHSGVPRALAGEMPGNTQLAPPSGSGRWVLIS
jgi:hypothetical protein